MVRIGPSISPLSTLKRKYEALTAKAATVTDHGSQAPALAVSSAATRTTVPAAMCTNGIARSPIVAPTRPAIAPRYAASEYRATRGATDAGHHAPGTRSNVAATHARPKAVLNNRPSSAPPPSHTANKYEEARTPNIDAATHGSHTPAASST